MRTQGSFEEFTSALVSGVSSPQSSVMILGVLGRGLGRAGGGG